MVVSDVIFYIYSGMDVSLERAWQASSARMLSFEAWAMRFGVVGCCHSADHSSVEQLEVGSAQLGCQQIELPEAIGWSENRHFSVWKPVALLGVGTEIWQGSRLLFTR